MEGRELRPVSRKRNNPGRIWDSILAVDLVEVVDEPLWRDILRNGFRVTAGAGLTERQFADVGAKQLQGRPDILLQEDFLQANRE